MSSAGEYVCTLDEKSLKKAKEELKEDPKNRLGAVDTFRQWVLQQPHIKCPTGRSHQEYFFNEDLSRFVIYDISYWECNELQ